MLAKFLNNFKNVFGDGENSNKDISVKRRFKPLSIVAPISGSIYDLRAVADGVFSEGVLGDGIAIMPTSNVVVSPFDGIITTTTRRQHAIVITNYSGIECLVHIGIDSINIPDAEGVFRYLVTIDEEVKAGQPLIEFDLNQVKKYATSALTPIVISNLDKFNATIQLHDNPTRSSKVTETILYNAVFD